MLGRVAFVRTDVSEECIASIIRVTRIGELGTKLAVTVNRNTLRATRRHIPEEGILELCLCLANMNVSVVPTAQEHVCFRVTNAQCCLVTEFASSCKINLNVAFLDCRMFNFMTNLANDWGPPLLICSVLNAMLKKFQ
jgi:hypothetical protein